MMNIERALMDDFLINYCQKLNMGFSFKRLFLYYVSFLKSNPWNYVAISKKHVYIKLKLNDGLFFVYALSKQET